MDIIQRINALYPKMTKKQKSIADCLLESPEDIAYITLAQLSKKTASSELTLLRFCQKLGYANFRRRAKSFSPRWICWQSSPPPRPSAAASASLSVRTTSPMCCRSFWRQGSSLLYFDPQIIDLSSLNDTQEKLEAMTPEDLVIFIAFPKYYYPLGSIAKNAVSRGAQLLTITDSISSPTVQYSKYLLVCHTSTRVFYNSLTLPMAMANLLLSYLVIDLGPDYRSRDLTNAVQEQILREQDSADSTEK